MDKKYNDDDLSLHQCVMSEIYKGEKERCERERDELPGKKERHEME